MSFRAAIDDKASPETIQAQAAAEVGTGEGQGCEGQVFEG
jgi:hypothetical protein